MRMDKTVEALNRLVEINNDRIEGYETAASETDEQALKSLFNRFARASHTCREELVKEITSLEGTPTEGTKNSGKLFRIWMDVKVALTSKDRKAIFNSCEFGEANARETYEHVLKHDRDHLGAYYITMINSQMSILKGDHDQVSAIREELRMYT